MNNLRKHLKLTIKQELITLFLFIGIAPILIIAIIGYDTAKSSMQSIAISDMQALARLKAERITVFYSHEFNVMQSLSDMPYLKNAFLKQDSAIIDNLQALSEDNSECIAIVSLDKKTAFSSSCDYTKMTNFDIAFNVGKRTFFASDVERKPNEIFTITVSIPMKDFSGKTVGVILREVNIGKLFKELQDYAGLGESGEILLGKEKNGNIIFLNDLRNNHDNKSPIIKLGSNIALPAQKAVLGNTGGGEAIDYRGENVIAAWRYEPSFGWGIVAKIDKSEAMHPLKIMKLDIIYSTIFLIFFGLLVSWWLANRYTRQIELIKKQIKEIETDNLTLQNSTNQNGDLDSLADSVNLITNRFKQTMANNQEAVKKAYTDKLTGVFNRAWLDECLKQTLENYDKKLALFFIDLDGFKSVNDTFGHSIGDALLIEVTNELIFCIKRQDIVVRLGGDEFVVILLDLNSFENAKQIATRILQKISEPKIINQQKVCVSASIGIALYPKSSTHIASLVKIADDAMYQAKNRGKNQFFIAN